MLNETFDALGAWIAAMLVMSGLANMAQFLLAKLPTWFFIVLTAAALGWLRHKQRCGAGADEWKPHGASRGSPQP